MYQLVDFSDTFPPVYGNIIHLPANSLFYRGYSTKFDAVSDRAAYYSNQGIAAAYTNKKNGSGTLSIFTNTRPLKLLDYRFLCVILKQYINDISVESLTTTDKQVLLTTMLSFGLTSFAHQMHLLRNSVSKEYFAANPGFAALEKIDTSSGIFEKEGVRIGETNLDSMTMGFLKGLLGAHFDGFISPAIYSPFHIEKHNNILDPEMILFNPKAAGIQIFRPEISLTENMEIPIIRISDIIKSLHNVTIGTTISFVMSGGAIKKRKSEHVLNLIEKGLNNNDAYITAAYNQGFLTGRKLSLSKPYIYKNIPPSPTTNVPVFS